MKGMVKFMLDILFIYMLIMYNKVKNKSVDELSKSESLKLEKEYSRYMNSKKGQENPSMTIEEYLPIFKGNMLRQLKILGGIVLSLYALIFLSGIFR